MSHSLKAQLMNKFRCNNELLCMNYLKVRFRARSTCIIATLFVYFTFLCRMSQELRSLLRDLIPEMILSKNVIYTWVQLATVQELRVFKLQQINFKRKKSIVHLLRHVVKCTVTDSPLNTQTSCSKCPPSAWMHFLTRVTRELVTLRSTAALLMVLAALRNRWSSSSLVYLIVEF